jgi:hypothetical protein
MPPAVEARSCQAVSFRAANLLGGTQAERDGIDNTVRFLATLREDLRHRKPIELSAADFHTALDTLRRIMTLMLTDPELRRLRTIAQLGERMDTPNL